MANKLSQIQNMIYEIRGQKVMLDSDCVSTIRCSFVRCRIKSNESGC
jgi:hypothetical protein